jgi:hypothetical protein
MHPAAIIGIVLVVAIIIGVIVYFSLPAGSTISGPRASPSAQPDNAPGIAGFTSNVPNDLVKKTNPVRQIDLGPFTFKY